MENNKKNMFGFKSVGLVCSCGCEFDADICSVSDCDGNSLTPIMTSLEINCPDCKEAFYVTVDQSNNEVK